MEKYKRYYGLGVFLATVVVVVYCCIQLISPKLGELESFNNDIATKEEELNAKLEEQQRVKSRLKQIETTMASVAKKIYAPVDSDLEKDSLFFTLYNDVIEMVHANSIKIKSIDYNYNPKEDSFVKSGQDYFVCDVNLELVSNYTNLGKLVQEIYQYPYYIKINKLDVNPYSKDKKILLTNMSLRLYAYTEPVEETTPIGNNLQTKN